jgi:hypothetical protein
MKDNIRNLVPTVGFTALFAIALFVADWASGKGVLEGIAPAGMWTQSASTSLIAKTSSGGDAW